MARPQKVRLGEILVRQKLLMAEKLTLADLQAFVDPRLKQ
jgi:hypothetical protein